MSVDSVAIGGTVGGSGPGTNPLTLKNLVLLLVVYLFISSDVFVIHGLKALSPNSVSDVTGSINSKGEIIRGVLLVAIYATVIHLADAGVL